MTKKILLSPCGMSPSAETAGAQPGGRTGASPAMSGGMARPAQATRERGAAPARDAAPPADEGDAARHKDMVHDLAHALIARNRQALTACAAAKKNNRQAVRRVLERLFDPET